MASLTDLVRPELSSADAQAVAWDRVFNRTSASTPPLVRAGQFLANPLPLNDNAGQVAFFEPFLLSAAAPC